MSAAMVYAVFGDMAQAERIAEIVVEERLAACANMFPQVRSIYRWEDKVARGDEVVAVFKTLAEVSDALIARISELHSYDVPCVVGLPITGIFGPCAEWIEQSVG